MKIPHNYQQECIIAGIRRNLLIADQTGLGKSLEACEIAKACTTIAGGHVLIIAPLKTLAQWEDLIIEQVTNAHVLRLDKNFAHYQLEDYLHECNQPDTSLWCVTHYEAVIRAAAELACEKWTCVIVDEAHRIKTRVTRAKKEKLEAKKKAGVKCYPPRTEAVKIATSKAQRKLALTGTPWDRNPADLWSILNWLYPKNYTSYWRFYQTYSEEVVNYFGYAKVVGCKDANALARELAPYTFARTKKEVAPQLPERIDTVVRVEMSPEQQELYTQLKSSRDIELIMRLLERGEEKHVIIKNTLALITKLLQVSADPQLLGFTCTSGKLEWLDDYLNDNPDEPTVIFTRYHDTAVRLAAKYSGDIIVGGMSNETRPGIQFLNGTKRLLFGTIGAMREGLNLQRARTEIFIDQEWSSIQMSQAVDRIHRIDITEPKYVIYLQSSPVDKLVYKAFTEKWAEATLVYNAMKELKCQKR